MIDFLSNIRHFASLGFGIASLVIACCALLGSVYALAFAIVGIRAARRKRALTTTFQRPPTDPSTRFLILIPAHNEGSGLVPTVESVLAQHYPRLQCIVVADNCTDDTASVARAAGTHDVLVRCDRERIGKGYALTWAFDAIKSRDWDAVCVLDADSVVDAGFFQALDASIRKGHSVVQARYDFLPAEDNRNWLQQFSAVSKAGENSFVFRARERLGLTQLLAGNGFALQRSVLERVPWRAHSIVEDAEYALTLARAGIAVHFQEEARLWSRQASSAQDLRPQRVRWASGTGQLLRRALPGLLTTAWKNRNWRALEEILMLLMTSRIVLIYLVVLSFLLSLIAPASFIATWSVLIVAAALQFFYLALMFRYAGDHPVPIKGLFLLPFYVSVIVSSQILAIAGFNRCLWWRTTR